MLAELVGLDVGDLCFGDDGLELTSSRSKTDQEGPARYIRDAEPFDDNAAAGIGL